jgi:catechol 2,3-dioxygenase-like lactoylglutathione lyase family enzyme
MTRANGDTVRVRYLVDDAQTAFDFYTAHLGFAPGRSFVPSFADVQRGHLRLLLAGPDGGRIVSDDPAGHPVELFQPAGS